MQAVGTVFGRSSATQLCMSIISLEIVTSRRCSLQRAAKMFVDVTADVALKVRQQDAAVAEPNNADGRRSWVDGESSLHRAILLVTLRVGDYVRSWLLDVRVTARTDVDVVCLTRHC